MLYRISDHKYGHVFAESFIYKGRAIGTLIGQPEPKIDLGSALLRALKAGSDYNCRAVEVGDILILKATKDIKPGEELIVEKTYGTP